MTNLPHEIAIAVGNRVGTIDSTGCSGSTVILYPDMVLKITPADTPDASREILPWLRGKLPAPEILVETQQNGAHYLLMTRIAGKMSCAPEYLAEPDLLLPTLAEGMRMLSAVPTDGCPRLYDLKCELTEAAQHLEAGLVAPENAHPGTFGPSGFASPEALLAYLEQNRPDEQLAFTHGDFCLPNLMMDDRRISGFIDLTHAGIADPYRDLSLCYMS
ncbi:MAG: aminoglycoside 3'-phosphotransferase, partial [Clostridia bacterium]|nr:aminoglycoside 3'-phosphotransferase [Clostridia bacterium]